MSQFLRNLIIIFISSPLWGQWENAETIALTDNNHQDRIGDQHISIDNSNFLHVIWTSETSSNQTDLFYEIRNTFGEWGVAVQVNEEGTEVLEASIAAQDPDLAYILYTIAGADANQMFLATVQEGIITREIVSENDLSKYAPMVGLDAAGNAHLAWIMFDELDDDENEIYKLFYTNRTVPVEGWIGAELFPRIPTTAEPSMVVTRNGSAHIAFINETFSGQEVFYTGNDALNAPWTNKILSTPNSNNADVKITEGNLNKLNIIISGDENDPQSDVYSIVLVPSNNSSTEPEPLLIGTAGILMDVTADNAGLVHVILQETDNGITTGNVLYLNNTNDQWSGSSVLEIGSNAYNSQIISDHCDALYLITQLGVGADSEIAVFGDSNTCEQLPSSIGTPQKDLEVKLFPQPFSDQFTVETKGASTFENYQLTLYSVTGKMIKSETMGSFNHLFTVDDLDLPSGLYVFELRGENIRMNKMVVKN